ncbi:ATP-binding protein [Nonomuraea fuscirosea]
MLFGRSAEIAAIDDLLGRARGGAGGALVLRGDAGVGKTALLDLAATRAGSMRVLRATGAEPESDLAFATLHQLLRPVTIPSGGLLDALPEPQREAVRGALGLAGAASGDRYLLAAGVLSLLAEASVPDGLVCVVDDFQWVDRASADALLFAARRLSTERIAMLLSVRGTLPVKGLPSLTLGGLPPDAATALLNADITSPTTRSGASTGAGVGVEAGVVRELVALTGGNPLALREIVRLLSPAQLAGREPLPDPLPGGAQLFGEQVAALSPQARQVALLAAVEGDLDLVLRAAARMGLSTDSGRVEPHDAAHAPGGSSADAGRAESHDRAPVLTSSSTDAGRVALHELEAAGLVLVSGAGVRFRHPLIRSAVHEAAAPADRRAVHAVLGGLCEGDRRAWHLAAAGGPAEPALPRTDHQDGGGAAPGTYRDVRRPRPGPHRCVRHHDRTATTWPACPRGGNVGPRWGGRLVRAAPIPTPRRQAERPRHR